MIIAVASGKGGTGKTTVATSLALSIAADRIRQLEPIRCSWTATSKSPTPPSFSSRRWTTARRSAS